MHYLATRMMRAKKKVTYAKWRRRIKKCYVNKNIRLRQKINYILAQSDWKYEIAPNNNIILWRNLHKILILCHLIICEIVWSANHTLSNTLWNSGASTCTMPFLMGCWNVSIITETFSKSDNIFYHNRKLFLSYAFVFCFFLLAVASPMLISEAIDKAFMQSEKTPEKIFWFIYFVKWNKTAIFAPR